MKELNLKLRRIIPHPQFNKQRLLNDISILYLTQEDDLATYTPACLAVPGDSSAYVGKMALAIGNLIGDKLTNLYSNVH